MKQILFLNQLPSGSFLTEKLLVKTYNQLRIGKQTYVELVWQSLNLAPAEYQFDLLTGRNFPESLNQSLAFQTLAPVDYLLVWDLEFLPIVPAQIKKVIEKCFVAKQPIVAKSTSGKIMLWGGTKAELQSDQPNLIPVDLNLKNLVQDLAQPEVAQAIMAAGLETRVFNTLKTSQFVFTKQSTQVKKIQAEYNFLTNLPAEIKHFYPQTLGLTVSSNQASYELERIFAFDLATLIKNQTIFQAAGLSQFFTRLSEYLTSLPRKSVSQTVYQAKLTELFITKLDLRVKLIRQLAIYEKLNQLCQLAGFKNLADFQLQLTAKLAVEISQTSQTELEFSHGDLSACNLLYDLQTHQLKLVDPRGWEKSDTETWRPPEYDLAKLSHSFLGGYDLINAELAKLVVTPNGLQTEFFLPSAQLVTINQQFKTFLSQTGFELKTIRLYEASLFLSLIPLHADAPAKNLLQLAQAISAFKQAEV